MTFLFFMITIEKKKGYDDMEPYTDNDMTEDASENDDSDIRRYLHSATAILILINVIIFLKTDISGMIGGEDVWIDKGYYNRERQ